LVSVPEPNLRTIRRNGSRDFFEWSGMMMRDLDGWPPGYSADMSVSQAKNQSARPVPVGGVTVAD
jgi:hypothetical protein